MDLLAFHVAQGHRRQIVEQGQHGQNAGQQERCCCDISQQQPVAEDWRQLPQEHDTQRNLQQGRDQGNAPPGHGPAPPRVITHQRRKPRGHQGQGYPGNNYRRCTKVPYAAKRFAGR
jgi:hypothetical protein